MPSFEVYGKCAIRKQGVTVQEVADLLKRILSKHYAESKLSITPTGLVVKGDLKSGWERAFTEAKVEITIQGNQLSYRAEGCSYVGKWPFVVSTVFQVGLSVLLLVGLVKHVEESWWSLLIALLLLGMLINPFADLVWFVISTCRGLPKKYFEDAFKAVEFEVG